MEMNKHVTSAFRLAHRASENGRFDLEARNVFRAIAHEIWQAYGRPTDAELDPAAGSGNE
jgi:hypothetical protein